MVSQVTDGEGNVLQHNEPNEVRQVVIAQTSERCRAILEKVVDGGTGKNARVEGYRIGGKTGSSRDAGDRPYHRFLPGLRHQRMTRR